MSIMIREYESILYSRASARFVRGCQKVVGAKSKREEEGGRKRKNFPYSQYSLEYVRTASNSICKLARCVGHRCRTDASSLLLATTRTLLVPLAVATLVVVLE